MTTQFAKASYQEIIDLHTESDKVSVIGIHTPTSNTPRKMFKGFFDQFKKFKYLGCSLSLVPAARLPADPLQVSYDAGEPTIDPRDMLNPLMFHGCHGNDMGAILNRLYALNSLDAQKMDSVFQFDASTDDAIDLNGYQLEDLYYKALTDNTWKKAHPQRGFRKSGLRPLVYSMATNHQLLGAAQIGINNSTSNLQMSSTQGLPEEIDYEAVAGAQAVDIFSNVTKNDIQFFTPRLTGLGWLDTRNAITTNILQEDVAVDATLDDVHNAVAKINADQEADASLPLVYMGMILLPPAYKTEQYFRMIVNHHFAFKDFRGISFSNTLIDTPAYANFNDPDWEQGGGEVDPDDPEPGPEPDPPEPDPPEPIAPDYRSLTYASSETHRNATFYFDLKAANNGASLPVADGTVTLADDQGTKTVLFPCLMMYSGRLYVSSGWSSTYGAFYLSYSNGSVDTTHCDQLAPDFEDDVQKLPLTGLDGYDQDFFDYLENNIRDPSTYPIILQQRT